MSDRGARAEDDGPLTTPDWRRRARRRLLDWFDEHRRELPWRGTDDLYAIWLSEIMLQQTQVATVVPYFQRFLAAFPDVESLAAADEQEVLRQWEGLGYYRRARQLHLAAQRIVAEHGGVFPERFEEVSRLPGIGRYTAGAILSIGRDQRQPILEANTVRLYSRLLAYPADPRGSAGQRALWRFAEELLPRRRAGDLNQALMDLGSMLCAPRSPACAECPLSTLCAARREGLQEQIPPPARRPAITDITEAAVVVHRCGQVLLRRCAADERWAGLWDFPRFALSSAENSGDSMRALAAGVQERTGVRIGEPQWLTTLRHGVTRYRITLHCHLAAARGGDAMEAADGAGRELRWVAPEGLGEVPLSVTGRKLARLVRELTLG